MSDEQSGAESRRRRKRRLTGAAVVVMVLLALLLAPPLINANRLAHRIATSMSGSLGRPVHLDNVTVNVLPFPGLTLENLVVSEDPSFGAEPVIRANKVTARLRFSSLWRRQVEFSTISFEVDEHGSGPSVNLVRRADGRWNLESILLHAAQQNAAPTEQRKASAVPRFPYIEATGARLNVKLGDEKMPLSLTDADFALWLPSPQQWRVRLTGKPARTDTSVSDTGVLTLEATLERATRLADVPVEMSANWRHAPLGEASRLLAGGDAGWRGNVEVTATAHGTLGDAAVSGTMKLSDVRRADFIPAKTLRLEVECRGRLAVTTAVVREPACSLPLGDTKEQGQSVIAATAETLNLTGLQAEGLRVGMTNVADGWWLDWARVFSKRIPSTLNLTGSVSGSAERTPPSEGGEWQGEFHGTLAQGESVSRTQPRAFTVLVTGSQTVAQISAGEKSSNSAISLLPVNVAATDKAPPLVLTATVSPESAGVQINGTATLADVAALRAEVPPLLDGLDQVLPGLNEASDKRSEGPMKIDVSCLRAWGRGQTCAVLRAPEVAKRPKRRR